MNNNPRYVSDVAFTPAVKAIQARKGSRLGYSRMEQQGSRETQITAELRNFIAAQTSIYMATANAHGQPHIQHRGGPAGYGAKPERDRGKSRQRKRNLHTAVRSTADVRPTGTAHDLGKGKALEILCKRNHRSIFKNATASMPTTSPISSAGTFQGVTDGKPSVALQDKLARCVRQLGDWQACPSSKTPEGKQIIQNLQTQIRSLESRIASTDKGAQSQPSTASSSQEASQVVHISRAKGVGLIGSLVDVFA